MGIDRDNVNPLNPFGPGKLRIDKMLNEVTGASSTTVRLAAAVLVRNTKILLSTPGKGRIRQHLVTRGKTRAGNAVVHIGKAGRASAPGDPPAPDTGTLRNSIEMGIVDGTMRVGTDLVQAPGLEFGTIADGGSIAPRPFLRPALAMSKDEMGSAIAASLKKRTRTL